MNEINNKLNIEFKIFCILSTVFLSINLLLLLPIFSDHFILIFFSVLSELLNYLFLLICTICGIINFIENKSKIVRRKIIIMLVILISINILVIVFNKVVDNIEKQHYENEKNKMINTAELLINKVKNDTENKYVYLLEDLKSFDSSLIYNYDPSSYINYFNDKVYICLSNDEIRIEGYENKLTESHIVKPCSYKFGEIYDLDNDTKWNEGEIYLEYYLEKKYDIDIISVQAYWHDSLFSSHIDHYNVTTNFGTFEAMVEVIDNKIVVTDNFE